VSKPLLWARAVLVAACFATCAPNGGASPSVQDSSTPVRPLWWDEALDALDSGRPARALELLDRPTEPAQALLAARALFAAGDLVGTTVAAARGLPGADGTERRELLWWGSNAALGLADADAAVAWTDQLRSSAGGDPSWRDAAERFANIASDLEATRENSADAVDRARVVSIAGLLTLALAGALVLRRRA
jgi:hypothetical protein